MAGRSGHWASVPVTTPASRVGNGLLITATTIEAPEYRAAGLRALRWLMGLQTSEEGHFRPVGSDSFGNLRSQPHAFDQQPIEATAAISACIAAWHADGDIRWKQHVGRAFAWFLGKNDLLTPLVDPSSGSCRDGLHPHSANENRGGESVVSYLMSVAEVRQFARLLDNRATPERLLA